MEHEHTVGRRSTNSSADLRNFAEARSVEDDEGREKRHKMDGWMAARPRYAMEYVRRVPIIGCLRTKTVNESDWNTQRCGQASDKVRVELSDGGGLNGYLRSCTGNNIPSICMAGQDGSVWAIKD